MKDLLILGAAAVGTYFLYQRGQKRLAACCPQGATQSICYQQAGSGFLDVLKHGLGSGPIPLPVCTVQQIVAKKI